MKPLVQDILKALEEELANSQEIRAGSACWSDLLTLLARKGYAVTVTPENVAALLPDLGVVWACRAVEAQDEATEDIEDAESAAAGPQVTLAVPLPDVAPAGVAADGQNGDHGQGEPEPKRKRTQAATDEELLKIGRLASIGCKVHGIAAEVGLSTSTVYTYLPRARKMWAEASTGAHAPVDGGFRGNGAGA